MEISDRRWLVACTVLAAALRLFRIGHQSLWIDEAISLQLATYTEGAAFWRGLLIDIHGPLTSALLHGWVRLGEGEAWLRTLYAIPAVATVPLVFFLGRNLFDRTTGRVAALALALSPFHVWYSQEIRSYSWAILWTTGALILFVRTWDGRATFRTWAGITVLLALGLLTNFSGLFLVLSLTAAVLVRRPFSMRFLGTWALVAFAAGAVFLPWLLDWFQRIGAERVLGDAPLPGVRLREASGLPLLGVPWAYWAFAFGYSLGPTLTELHLDRTWGNLVRHAPVLAAGALAVGGAALAGLSASRRRGRLPLVLALLLVPLVLASLLAMREVKTFHPRYLVASFPVFVVLLAAGWAQSGKALRASFVVAGALAVVSIGQHYFHPAYAKEDSRSAARLVLERELPGDAVAVIYSFRPFRHYFSDTAEGRARLHHVHKRYLATDEGFRAFVEECAKSGGRVWLVLSRWWDVAPEPRIRSYFDERMTESERWSFPGVKVTLYEPVTPGTRP